MLMLNIHLAISELCQGSQHPCLFLRFGLFSAKKLLRYLSFSVRVVLPIQLVYL